MKSVPTRVFLLIFCLPATLMAQPELTGTPEELSRYLANAPGRVTIAGESELIVPADEMKITYAIKTRHSSLKQALAANKKIRDEITSYLVKQGLAEDNISSEKFSSTPKQGLFGERPKSYEVINKLNISIKSDVEFATVATIADQWKQALYQHAEARQTDKEKHKREAVQKALEDAMTKKTVYEKTLKLKLRPKQVYNAHTIMQQPFLRESQFSMAGNEMIASDMARPEPAMVTDDGDASFGSFTYHANVQLEFIME